MDVKKELIQGLKAILTKWEGQEPVVEVKMETLDDGTKIRIDGEVLEADKAVFVVTDEGEMPMPDGTYVIESGDSFTVVEGVITEVIKKEDAPAEMQENVELSAIKEEFKSLKSEVNSLKILLDKSKESEKTVLSVAKKLTEVLESLSSAPSAEPTETKHSATIQKEEKLNNLVQSIKSLKK